MQSGTFEILKSYMKCRLVCVEAIQMSCVATGLQFDCGMSFQIQRGDENLKLEYSTNYVI